ncbi:MAG: radical SAM protein [Chlorobi bacterium]|nr:radical SAM protein [Chlorobiota bacterium]
MSKFPDFKIDNQWVTSRRGKKNPVNPFIPYDFFMEKERTGPGVIGDVTTIFLTNRECPFRCLMCDLWKNTTDKPVPEGAIPRQIEYALSRLPETKHLKLYNSGSFFDTRAVPKTDYEKIASLIDHFETVIVESHPQFINRNTLYFNELIKPALHVAIGLETVHPAVLPRLNKRMTLTGFEQAVRFLTSNGMETRTFILLRPPFLSEEEGMLWAKKSIDYAFKIGVGTCTVIPVRSGNGAMDTLAENSYFTPPDIKSLENVIEYGIGLNKGTVFADLWNIENFNSCKKCLEKRKERLSLMNFYQKIYPQVTCLC